MKNLSFLPRIAPMLLLLCTWALSPLSIQAQETAPASAEVSAATNSPASLTEADADETTYFDEFIDKVKKGGLIMIILLVLSVVGIGFIFERLGNLTRKNIATPGLADKAHGLYMSGKFDELHSACRNDRSALSRIILAVVDHRNCSIQEIQSLAGDIGSRVMRIHLQKAYPLAIIATLSPLLGLLGTIVGMIGAFGTVASVGQMGDASILADDIAKALVTTAGGLIVAIPMLGFYHYFRTRTNSYAVDLEEDVSELISAWFLRNGAGVPQADQSTED